MHKILSFHTIRIEIEDLNRYSDNPGKIRMANMTTLPVVKEFQDHGLVRVPVLVGL